jgi:cytochrome c oxidase assembly protein subunit 15
MFNKPKYRKPGFKLALVTTVLSAVVITLGTYTSLAEGGFGCSDWPSCYGVIAEHGIGLELIHRYLAGILGALITVLAVGSWRRRDDESYPFRLPTFILFLVVWQVLLGMWAVNLALWPQVVGVHLLGGIVNCSLLWLLTLRLDNKRWKLTADTMDRLAQVKPWIIGAMVVVIVQILLGGWTSATYTAFACPEFPLCQGQWWSEIDFWQGFNIAKMFGVDSVGETMESNVRVAIHVIHRLATVVSIIYVLGLAILLLTIKDRRIRHMPLILIVLLSVQLLLVIGSGQVQATLLTAIVHNVGGVLLLLTLVTLATRVWTAKLKYQRPES